MSRVFVAILSFSLSLSSYGQTLQPEKRKKIVLDELLIQTAVFGEFSQEAGLADFQKLVPNSSLLQKDLNGFQQSNSSAFYASSALSAQTGWKLFNPKTQSYRSKVSLRLGFNLLRGYSLSSNWYQNESFTFDSLTSSQNDLIIYRDSVYNRNFSANYQSTQFRLDAAMVWKSSSEKRLQVWGGLGINAGISLNSIVDVNFIDSGRIVTYDNNNEVFYQQGDYFASGSLRERSSARNNFGFSAYVPLGISFRIGNKSELLRRFHLVFEARPGLNATVIRGLNSTWNPSFQYGIGLKVSL